jgi:hypothetical protein
MEIKFKVYPGDKGEKKHSRRYHAVEADVAQDDIALSDIYVKRPWSNNKDKLVVTIDEK